jgi:hypothetical protein
VLTISVKIRNLFLIFCLWLSKSFQQTVNLIERGQEMALWVLLWVGLCVGQNPMCHLCVGIKIICGWAFFNFFLGWQSCGCRVTLSSSSQNKPLKVGVKDRPFQVALSLK